MPLAFFALLIPASFAVGFGAVYLDKWTMAVVGSLYFGALIYGVGWYNVKLVMWLFKRFGIG